MELSVKILIKFPVVHTHREIPSEIPTEIIEEFPVKLCTTLIPSVSSKRILIKTPQGSSWQWKLQEEFAEKILDDVLVEILEKFEVELLYEFAEELLQDFPEEFLIKPTEEFLKKLLEKIPR